MIICIYIYIYDSLCDGIYYDSLSLCIVYIYVVSILILYYDSLCDIIYIYMCVHIYICMYNIFW